MRSLRTRISLGTTAATTSVLFITALLAWLASRSQLYHAIDKELAGKSALTAHHLGVFLRPMPMHSANAGPEEFRAQTGTTFLQIIDASNHTEIFRSASLPDGVSLAGLCDSIPNGIVECKFNNRYARIMINDLVPVVGDFQPPPGFFMEGKKSVATPMIGVQAEPPWPDLMWTSGASMPPSSRYIGRHLLVYYGYDISSTVHDVQRLGLILGVVWVVASALAAMSSLWVRRAILLPVARLSDDLRTIDPTQGGVTVVSREVPDEIKPLVDRLNTMFAKVEAAFKREKTTIANITHELRTPLSGMRTTLEVALKRPEIDHGSALAMKKVLAMSVSLQNMVVDLLTIARLEAGQEPLRLTPLDLTQLISELWESFAESAMDRHLDVQWQLARPLMATTSAEWLSVIISNIFDNIISHTPEQGHVLIRSAGAPGMISLEFSNSTRELSSGDASFVFQPFWRNDNARTATGLHCGLGLALTQRVVSILGGTIEASVQEGMFRLKVGIPTQARLP